MIPIFIIQRLLTVIALLTNNSIPLDDVIEYGTVFHAEKLASIKTTLLLEGRHDLVEVIEATMQGNLELLEKHEDLLRPPDANDELPRIFYKYSQQKKPVRQESAGGREMSDHVLVASENQDGRLEEQNISERLARDEEWPSREHDPAGPSELLSFDHPSLGGQPAPLADDAATAELCCICRRNIQNVKRSTSFWTRLNNIISRFKPQQLCAFKTGINEYRAGILNDTHQSPIDIVRALHGSRCAHDDGKCDICLILYALKRIGCWELVNELMEALRRREGTG